ncbi:transposase [Yersinia mollaretii ATCC 43969]|uniref:Transposase n=1 Tax=Yersinia mollaretii (strain ATCC 43969 / DSM 18520 / CIP 103324 / CNY 7263 / WAIP 204) TaxID=349967 RepID=A0ABP2EJD1_YERMW|nr:transposase [Yersinia mollaretii ATCC 43969]
MGGISQFVREAYCGSNGSAGARNIAVMVTTKGMKLSRWRAYYQLPAT